MSATKADELPPSGVQASFKPRDHRGVAELPACRGSREDETRRGFGLPAHANTGDRMAEPVQISCYDGRTIHRAHVRTVPWQGLSDSFAAWSGAVMCPAWRAYLGNACSNAAWGALNSQITHTARTSKRFQLSLTFRPKDASPRRQARATTRAPPPVADVRRAAARS